MVPREYLLCLVINTAQTHYDADLNIKLVIKSCRLGAAHLRSRKRRFNLPEQQRKRPAVLHFSCDRTVLFSRGQFLRQAGYRVLNSSSGFDAIRLATSGRVHAVVLDLDHNDEDVTLIAQEIKRLRPEVPTIVLTETAGPVNGVSELADALVPKEDGHNPLLKSLRALLTE
jgi:CheY-like chemotaxis protein